MLQCRSASSESEVETNGAMEKCYVRIGSLKIYAMQRIISEAGIQQHVQCKSVTSESEA